MKTPDTRAHDSEYHVAVYGEQCTVKVSQESSKLWRAADVTGILSLKARASRSR